MSATITVDITARLDYLRTEIQNDRVSYSEIAELESLSTHIDPSDTELLQWAGVQEFTGYQGTIEITVDAMDDFPRPTPDQIETMLTALYDDFITSICANCGDPLTDDDGTGYYCSRCAHTMQYHS